MRKSKASDQRATPATRATEREKSAIKEPRQRQTTSTHTERTASTHRLLAAPASVLASRPRRGGGGVCLPPSTCRAQAGISLLPVRAVVVVASACRAQAGIAPKAFASPRRIEKNENGHKGASSCFSGRHPFFNQIFAGVFFGRLGKKEKSRPRSDQPRTSYLLVGSRLRLKACACSSSDEVTSFVSHRCLLIQTIAKLANLVIVPPGEFEQSTCGVTGDTNEERVRGTK